MTMPNRPIRLHVIAIMLLASSTWVTPPTLALLQGPSLRRPAASTRRATWTTTTAFPPYKKIHGFAPRGSSASSTTRQPQFTPSHVIVRQSSSTTETDKKKHWRQALAVIFSQRAAARNFSGDASEQQSMQIFTLLRVSIPSILAGIVATLTFPGLSMGLATLMNDAGVFTVLSTDSSQFVQNFLTVAGLLFSILVGQTYCT